MKEEVSLPDNAFRPLKEGEEYEPLMKPNKQYREVTPWSIVWGLLMAVIFSAATAYLGLKVGQVFEAAIPITIIAVGVSGATHRKDVSIPFRPYCIKQISQSQSIRTLAYLFST